jgi:hypothetical protein
MIMIGVTGWGKRGIDKGGCEQAGFDALLLKPVNYVQLKAVIAELFTRKRSSRRRRKTVQTTTLDEAAAPRRLNAEPYLTAPQRPRRRRDVRHYTPAAL